MVDDGVEATLAGWGKIAEDLIIGKDEMTVENKDEGDKGSHLVGCTRCWVRFEMVPENQLGNGWQGWNCKLGNRVLLGLVRHEKRHSIYCRGFLGISWPHEAEKLVTVFRTCRKDETSTLSFVLISNEY